MGPTLSPQVDDNADASVKCSSTVGSGGAATFLGSTIEEKTRSILGWTKDFTPSLANQSSAAPMLATLRRHSVATTSGFPGTASPPAASGGGRPERLTKKRSSTSLHSGAAPYPYSLLNNENRVRKSDPMSPSTSTPMDIPPISKMLSKQSTPPPSPIFNQNGVTIMSLPRHPGNSDNGSPMVASSPPQGSPIVPPPPSYYQATAAGTPGFCGGGEPAATCYYPISPVSPNTPMANVQHQQAGGTAKEAFERLRQLIPNLTTEQSKYKALVQTVAHVIELEARLALLKEETRGLSDVLASQQRVSCSESASLARQQQASSAALHGFGHSDSRTAQQGVRTRNPVWSTTVPDDLLNLDLTAFKCLVQSPSAVAPASLFGQLQSCGYGYSTPDTSCSDTTMSAFDFSEEHHHVHSLTVDTSFGQSTTW